MKLYLASLLGFVALGILLWFSIGLVGNFLEGAAPGAAEISADGEQGTAERISAQAASLPAVSGSAARDSALLDEGLAANHVDSTAERSDVLDALREPDALRRLKQMAAEGNLFAMYMVGHQLMLCSPRGRELSRYRIAQMQRSLERDKNKLLGREEAEVASAASVASLTLSIALTEENLREQEARAARCERPEYQSPSEGVDWIERAVASGNDVARLKFVRTVVHFYGRPRFIARYPRRAIALRNQARMYLEQVKAQCTLDSVRAHAWWSVALYPFDIEQRYVAVYSWLRLERQRTGEDVTGRWGASQEAALQRLITPAQKQRAEARIEAMFDRCGES